MDMWPIIEKIRQTGRLDHGSFTDEISVGYSSDYYPKGLYDSARYCANADRTNSWLFSDAQVAIIEENWEEVSREYRAKLQKEREQREAYEAERAEQRRLWEIRRKQMLADAEERRRRDAEFDKAEAQPYELVRKLVRRWLNTELLNNPSRKITDEEIRDAIARAQTVVQLAKGVP